MTETASNTPIAVVTAEAAWPVRTGGQARVAGIIGVLARRWPVTVVGPVTGAPDGIDLVHVAAPFRSRLAHFGSPRPRLGLAAFGDHPQAASEAIARRPYGAIVVTHSYLAPMIDVPPRSLLVADFPNIEVDRQRSLAAQRTGPRRWAAHLESRKARRWERGVARSADLAIAVDDRDAARLRAWGADPVLLPNAASPGDVVGPSPSDGHVLYVCSADYPPNRAGGTWLVEHVWPLVRRTNPDARLVIVGRRTDEIFAWARDRPGVDVLGTVDDLGPWFGAAAITVAPVSEGGGTQLKVVEGLARGRLVVATPYSERSVPAAVRFACRTADDATQFADGIRRLLDDPVRRHELERRLGALAPTLGWDDACGSLVAVLAARLDGERDDVGRWPVGGVR